MKAGTSKTTVYLPAPLKEILTAAARRRGVSEAELIREGIALVTAAEEPRRPRLPLFDSGQPGLAEQFDELLKGFRGT
ncbi:MAG TPA: CopG family transcriptional regulator [Candidatus Limnocylindrales bacterium]